MVLGDRTGTVGLQQPTKVIGLGLELFTDVRFGNFNPGVHPLKNEGVVGNIVIIANASSRPSKGWWDTMRIFREL